MELRRIKRIGIIILVLTILLLILRNIEPVSINLLLWDLPMPKALLILLSALIGCAIGMLIMLKVGRPKKAEVQPASDL